jgi:hypothetical protein
MTELDKAQVLADMQSDMKMWDLATTSVEGTTITKSLTLPWGIGEVTINFEGVKNAQGKRAAVEMWGSHVRELVKERIDDEAVTRRAQLQAASRTEEAIEAVGEDNSGRIPEGSPEGGPAGPTSSPGIVPEAVPPHAEDGKEFISSGAGFAARRSELRGYIQRAESNLARARKELAAIEAALAVMEGSDELEGELS